MLIQRVIVAGAGLAGMVVANELARDGRAVTVIEGRDRVGGRVWTVRDPFRGGAFGELGAEFVDEDHRRMQALARRLDIELVRVLRRGFTQRYRTDAGGFELTRTRGWDDLRAALAPLVRDYKIAAGTPDAERVRELSTFSVREWLRYQDAPTRVHALADAMRGFFLADPEDLSALPLAAELAQGGSPAQTPMFRIAGGAERLLAALSHDTDARVLLSHRLEAVRHATDRVVCQVLDENGRRQEIEGDVLIVTLPASTLREIEIVPALPHDQWRAICSLRYGCASKAVVQTSTDLFGGRPARAFATDTHAGAFWDAGEGQPAGTSIVSFLAGGSASEGLWRRLADGADLLLSDLCWLRRGGRSPRAVAHAAWSWHEDPFARGGYAFIDPGFDPAWLSVQARRAGRLFFAGEHTSANYQGYMEGALESAERVLTEVFAA
jgi:monoamine oxidase